MNKMRKKFGGGASNVGVAIMVVLAVLVSLTMLVTLTAAPVTAASPWGKSVNVAVLPSSYGPRTSYEMGSWSASNYPDQTFTDIQFGDVNPTTLASYDTVFMFASNPNLLTAQEKADLITWVFGGGKLIIWPGEDPVDTPEGWDYSWLPMLITIAVPGPMGATGSLTITEPGTGLTQGIDADYIALYTDAVGDADLFTTLTLGWYSAMDATNGLGITGPVELYAYYGTGIIILNGLDWDYGASEYSSDPALILVMKNMFDVSTLPGGVPWSGNLEVTKTTDKSSYNVGETITFTVTVTNKQPVAVTNVMWFDTPPDGIAMNGPISGVLSNLDASGGLADHVQFTITATAVKVGTALENDILITGIGPYNLPFSGSAAVSFDIVKPSAIIDIKPGCFPNCISPKYLFIPIAILGTSTFDVKNVDRMSLTFGPTGTEAKVVMTYLSDVNGDGRLDLCCYFWTMNTHFKIGDTKGVLDGNMLDGKAFTGTDSVKIVPK